MATKKGINVTVTLEMIRSGSPEYTPVDGEEAGVRYQVADGKQVYIRTVTPALVRKYNEHSKKKLADGKPDPADDRTSHDVAVERMPTITAPHIAGLDWDDVPMAIIWRIVEDFLSLSSPTLRPETESSIVFQDNN